MPIMSAVAAGALTQKKRIPASRNQIQNLASNGFILDNGSTFDLNTAISGLNTFPHPGAITFTLDTPVYNQGTPDGTPLTRDGDILTLNTIPFTGGGATVTYGTGHVDINITFAATHDFEEMQAVRIAGGRKRLVHDASDSAFNGGSAIMNRDGEVVEWICPVGYTGNRCAEAAP